MSHATGGASTTSTSSPPPNIRPNFTANMGCIVVLIAIILFIIGLICWAPWSSKDKSSKSGKGKSPVAITPGLETITFSSEYTLTPVGVKFTLQPGEELAIAKGYYYYDFFATDSIEFTAVSSQKQILKTLVMKNSTPNFVFPAHTYMLCKNTTKNPIEVAFFDVHL